MIIGIDAMGGDFAPQSVLDAVKDIDIDIILIGDKEKLKNKLSEEKIVHSSSIIEMEESPIDAFKNKKDSSIGVGISLLKEGKIDAFVSAGNTGACVMFSSLELGRIKGIKKPGLGTFFPTENDYTFVIDVGATTEVKPENLCQFGIMGSIVVEELTHKNNPKVAILSVGEEDIKGSTLTKEAFYLMKNSGINFIGNIEGHQILEGKADVVVCDGMIGNILLKFGESVVDLVEKAIKKSINNSIKTKIAGIMLKNSLKTHFTKLKYQKYGGAILLGVNGTVIICHGRSSSETIRNAIYTAKNYAQANINLKIQQKLNNTKYNGNIINAGVN